MNGLRIGFAYDKPVKQGRPDEVESVAAEYEDEDTLSWMRATLQQVREGSNSSATSVVDLPWGPDILARLAEADLDVIFNITEAISGRNRESIVPALAEAKGIPYTGTDAVGLGISLDKCLTKIIAHHLGIPTPGFVKVDSIRQWEQLKPSLSFAGLITLLRHLSHSGTSCWNLTREYYSSTHTQCSDAQSKGRDYT